ncbi:MAG: hypothetical protein C7B45_16585 [Sulfobacillus acidophilus]|uniref:DUF4367 domain-containing protein n=1 Tax=Sulfobacillus acidophilus TaxID=53633 RepID=A0A2T2WCY2_9FIRM|nr:MAG: hypothetical protein C7B45_16585 [Sulfobacillus acidophilus]
MKRQQRVLWWAVAATAATMLSACGAPVHASASRKTHPQSSSAKVGTRPTVVSNHVIQAASPPVTSAPPASLDTLDKALQKLHIKGLTVLAPGPVFPMHAVRVSGSAHTYSVFLRAANNASFRFGGELEPSRSQASGQLLNMLKVSAGPGTKVKLRGVTVHVYTGPALVTWSQKHWIVAVYGNRSTSLAPLKAAAQSLILQTQSTALPSTTSGVINWNVATSASSSAIDIAWQKGASVYWLTTANGHGVTDAVNLLNSLHPLR